MNTQPLTVQERDNLLAHIAHDRMLLDRLEWLELSPRRKPAITRRLHANLVRVSTPATK